MAIQACRELIECIRELEEENEDLQSSSGTGDSRHGKASHIDAARNLRGVAMKLMKILRTFYAFLRHDGLAFGLFDAGRSIKPREEPC